MEKWMLLNEQCLTIPQPISPNGLPIKQGAQLNKKALRWAWAEENVSASKSSASVSPIVFWHHHNMPKTYGKTIRCDESVAKLCFAVK